MSGVLRARHVLGYESGDHVLITDGEVAHADGVITYVGPRRPGPGEDLGDALLLPGFVDLDAVTDLDHAILDSWSGRDLRWSREYVPRRRDVFTRAERAVIREFGLVQLLLHGITTAMPIAAETHSAWAETREDMQDMAAVAQRLGIRAYLGPSYRSGVPVTGPDVVWDEAEGERGFAGAVAFLDDVEALGDPRIRGALLPCRIETVSPALLAATAKVGAERGVPIRIHALQGAHERRLLGRSPVAALREAGLLDTHLLVPHGLFLEDGPRTPPSAAALAELAGVAIVHCPLTSARYGGVLNSFDRYRAAGLTIALGTDSFPPDLVRGMDTGGNLAKWVDGRLDAGSAADYLRAATLGGAAALRRPDLGRLAVGARADLVGISLADPRVGMVDDPVRTLLMHGSGRDVVLTVVDGRTVARDGRVPGVDLEDLRARAQALFARMRAAYSERDAQARPADRLFPPSFRKVR
ncbi:chlorohydrolase family protein [Pseudonocardia sp. WMMC193]|uniref:chlorohydrolase family protein n=1 Tax=Pseudonocardia sp. WMMC193 TaxID=2911965 RepID=UPI001F1CB886|nr:chlorohydrolase family protein [Pseudonocardia sp. WMMC193]MCF7547537.1 chlorohydrolase family protein [Pseudonocardia sp. WMMC193]